jgi:hypothetical protein
MDKKISADWLYHYTRNIESLKGILSTGFRYSRLEEALPYGGGTHGQASYAVCFCDLTLTDTELHRTLYGSLAIALTKEWGIRNGVSPVRYVHSTSPGTDINYRFVKTLKYDSDEAFSDATERALRVTTRMRSVRDYVGAGNEISFPFMVNANVEQKYFNELAEIVTNTTDEKAAIFRHTFEALSHYIQILHNELEIRDHFMRVYEEFSDNTLVRRYDEREWRASWLPSREEFEQLRLNGIPRGMRHQLGDEFNIKFDDSDVKHIIVSNKNEKANLESYLNGLGRDSLIRLIQILP